MEGQRGRIRRFAVEPVYSNKSLTVCSSDFVFRKYKQDSAFRVIGVLQLAKTGPPVTKNFPLRRLFPSGAMMTRRFYTPLWRQMYQFEYFDRARNVAHFDSNWPTLKLGKKFVRACPKPKQTQTVPQENHGQTMLKMSSISDLKRPTAPKILNSWT